MYGGLFGDLPAARGTANDNGANKAQGGEKDESKTKSNSPNKTKPSMMFLPPAARKKATTTPSSSASSVMDISRAVGAAGTTMAFVPTTVQRKRPNHFAKALETPAKKAATPATTTAMSKPPTSSTSIHSTLQKVTEKHNTDSAEPLTAPIDIHGTMSTTPGSAPGKDKLSGVGNANALAGSLEGHPAGGRSTPANLQVQQREETTEDPREISDPYDPYVPNDLLQYWDRKALAEEQKHLEEEAIQALEQQRVLREQLEQEREALQRRGDLDRMASSASSIVASGEPQVPPPGRGRGRGVSNLPAWLVDRQRQQQLDGLGNAPP